MSTAPAEPAARFAISLVEDARGRLLFLHRAPDRELGPGQWGFPAGHIEAGESPQACAARELREEIGDGHRVRLRASLGPVRDTWYGGVFEVHLFHWEWLDGRVVLNAEHTEHAWLAPGEHRALDVMDGVDEDIWLLGVWPVDLLNRERLPRAP